MPLNQNPTFDGGGLRFPRETMVDIRSSDRTSRPRLGESSVFGRAMRVEPPELQGIPTAVCLMMAVSEGDSESAQAWLRYWKSEFDLCYDRFKDWNPCIVQLLSDATDNARADSAMEFVHSRLWGLAGLDSTYSIEHAWEALEASIAELDEALSSDVAFDDIEDFVVRIRDEYERIHDLQVAVTCSLLGRIPHLTAEEDIGRILEKSLEPWIEERYDAFLVDDDSWTLVAEEFFRAAAQSMRGHLSGPERWGSFEVETHPTYWAMELDTCGSGCQASRGSRTLPSLLEHPDLYGCVTRAYSWSWGRSGVPYYCGHCALLGEIMPTRLSGHPLRVTPAYQHPGDAVSFIIPRRFPLELAEKHR